MQRLIEIRAVPDTREIVGTVVSYGDVAKLPWGEERFLPGSITWNDNTMLTLQHDRGKALARVGAGMVLHDSETSLVMRAVMPRTQMGEDTLTLVRDRVLTGLSLEFVPKRTRMENRTLTVIEEARMTGLSIVDIPAYSESVIARERAKQAPRSRVWL